MYGAIAQAGIGLIQTGIAAAKASNLPDPKEHTVSPELRAAYNMSRRRADEGYSPEERAAFEQMLARQGTAAKRMFQNVGLAGAGSAAANIMGIDALNQFASQGANIRRQNAGQYYGLAGQVDQVHQMETSRFNNRLMAEEQALGGAMQAGIGNMFGGIQSGMNFGQNEKAISAYQGMGQGGGPSNGAGQLPTAPQFKPAGGGFTNIPSPQWNTFESQGTPFLPNSQQVQTNPNVVDPSLLGTQPFGSYGFGQAPNWNQIWGK